MISGDRVFTVTLRAALRRNAQFQHLAFRAERKRLERKQFILAADPVNRALDLFCRSIKRRLARRQQQPAIFWNALEQLHLFLRNAFTVAKRRNMRQADIGENAVVRPRNLFQRRHFSGRRDADFKNRQRLRLLRRKHRQRKTKLAVVTSGRSQHLPARKQRLQSVFNDCLAVAAGDRQHALKIFPPMPARQSLQSAQRIGNHDHRPRRIKRRASRMILRELFFFNQGRACAVAERIGQENDGRQSAGLSAQQTARREQRRASRCRCGR